jgi:sulfur oxidation protein
MLGTAIAIWFSGTGKCRRNYSLPMLEVAGSNPASAANDGRVAQRIERVTTSPPLVAEVPLYGRMPAGLHFGIAGSTPANA